MSSLHYHEPPRDISPERVSQYLGWLASQDKGPVLTLLALLALRAVLHSSGPRLTRHGTYVNHACPPRLRFTHVATSLVAKIFVVHQSPKPKQHMLGATHARFD